MRLDIVPKALQQPLIQWRILHQRVDIQRRVEQQAITGKRGDSRII
jgi:hypothetical protein